METLQVLGAADKPILTVFNKIDRLTDHTVERQLVAEWPNSVAISATLAPRRSMIALVANVVPWMKSSAYASPKW